ncbi:MAG: hypothetical protein H6R16_2692 [Proteobacteria bacterium]|nr:hypothetical protein [Pseudomonadota bacterium]
MRRNRPSALNAAVDHRIRQISEKRWTALRRDWRREGVTTFDRQNFRNELEGHHRRQSHQRWQRSAKIMRRQAKLAGMRRQAFLVASRMLDGMRPRRQLGEEENGNEKEVTQLKHLFSLSGLHYVQMAKVLAQSTWTSSPFKYSPSGKFRATGWSAAPDSRRTMRALRSASSAESAMIFWNISRPTPPEHE